MDIVSLQGQALLCIGQGAARTYKVGPHRNPQTLWSLACVWGLLSPGVEIGNQATLVF